MTGSDIIIGTYTDGSGVTAMWGVNNINSLRLMFDQVNATGGLNGRKIKNIFEDNQYQEARSVQAVNKLINQGSDEPFQGVVTNGHREPARETAKAY